jgi:hypothetical protein
MVSLKFLRPWEQVKSTLTPELPELEEVAQQMPQVEQSNDQGCGSGSALFLEAESRYESDYKAASGSGSALNSKS